MATKVCKCGKQKTIRPYGSSAVIKFICDDCVFEQPETSSSQPQQSPAKGPRKFPSA